MMFDVREPGPFEVGHRIIEATYESPGEGGSRTIAINLWYPTAATSGENPEYAKIFDDFDVWSNVEPLPPAYPNGYPVVVHSHGHRGYGGNSADLMRHFATHGWLAVAPEHVDDTLLNAIDPTPFENYFQRPLDIRTALDAVEGFSSDGPLKGLADMSRVVMTGHSRGVFTVWAIAGAAFDRAAIEAACMAGDIGDNNCSADNLAVFDTDLSDPRVKAVIPMAGGPRDQFFGADGYDAIDRPVMLMTGSEDEVGAQDLFDQVTDVDLTWVDVEGGCHQLYGFGDCPSLSNEEGFAIVDAFALSFARRHGMDDDDEVVLGILDGSVEVSSRATLQAK